MTQKISQLLHGLSKQEQQQLFDELRKTHPIHKLEAIWNISAEFVLEAISRSQDITKRGVRGIIAELAFSRFILDPMKPAWTEEILVGDLAYDSLITKGNDSIKIQTKNQRLIKGIPLHPTKTSIKHNPEIDGWFIAETQKTRTGTKKKKKTESADIEVNDIEETTQTRPYSFGEFDILSVCMQPSTKEWTDFMFTPAKTLLPKDSDKRLIATFQPVPPCPMYNWTNDLELCIKWVMGTVPMPAPLDFKYKSKILKIKPEKNPGINQKLF